MKVWLLVIYVAGALPPSTISVERLASQVSCEKLGEQLVADHKQVNSANRYIFRCYEYDQAP